MQRRIQDKIGKSLRIIPDEIYLKLFYWYKFKKKLDLSAPKTFTEKIQWIKLFDRNPLYVRLADKIEAKAYVSEKIGSEYVVPTIGVWNSFSEIPFEELPDSFVIKCTHDSGSVVLCNDKSKLNYENARKEIDRCLKHNYFYSGREWAYKSIVPRVYAEQYLVDDNYREIRDYKFFCFNGIPKLMFIATNRQSNAETCFDFYDMEGNYLNIRNGHPNASKKPELPLNFDKMKTLASVLSEGIRQVRVDFYEVNGQIFFGEFTFYHFSGLTKFIPDDWDSTIGSWVEL